LAKLKKPTVKNPDLVAAMADLKEKKTSAAENAMIEELKKAQLIAPVIMDDIPEDIDLSDGQQYKTQAKFMMLQQKDGSRYFPAFTEWLEVLKWRKDPEIKTVVMTVEQYVSIMARSNESAGLVINPTEQGMVLTRERLAAIAGVALPPTNGAATPLPEPTVNPNDAFADPANISNPQLVGAIAAFRKQSSPETERPMVAELHKARFIAPVRLVNPDAKIDLKPGEKHQTQIQFVMVQNGDKKFFPLFTDVEELNKWSNPPEYQTMILPFAQYASMFQQNGDAEGLVINPFRQGESLAMQKQQVVSLAQMQQQQQLQLFDLKDMPLDLMKELSAHLETVPEVHAAYLTGMRVAGKESFMFVLDCDKVEETRPIFEPIAGIANKYTNGNPCGIITTEHAAGKKITERTEPFYQETK
jgi:hypothetical protein